MGDQPPGTLYRFTPQDVQPRAIAYDSLHQLGILEAIRMAELLNMAPRETVIIGIQPDCIDWGLTPTKPLERMIPKIIHQVMKEIDSAKADLSSEKTIN